MTRALLTLAALVAAFALAAHDGTLVLACAAFGAGLTVGACGALLAVMQVLTAAEHQHESSDVETHARSGGE